MGLVCRSSVLGSVGLLFYGGILSMCFGLVKYDGSLVLEWDLSSTTAISFSFPLVLDCYSVLFAFVVALISSMVLLFSTSYMDREEYLSRFVWLIITFVVAMNFLIFTPSLFAVVLGWDGLGLISFVLVMYYQSDEALGAALVTALINRLGDVLLLGSICFLSISGYWEIWGLSLEDGPVGLVLVLVAVLSMTNSAQMPFSYWLPAAMMAPTPVSALVHSSTLVTAGIYLIIRMVIGVGELQVGGFVSSVLLVAALSTNVMAGFSACFEVDLNKIVALSTLSQLGVIMLALAMGYHSLAFFHLLSHALFKALMFISVGRVIHCCGDSQDLRDVGGIWQGMPWTSGCWLLGSMSLIGLPFLSGFYSKDLVVEGVLSGAVNLVVFVGISLGIISTVIYSLRVVLSVFWGNLGGGSVQCVEGGSFYDFFPGFVLALGAVFGGRVLQSCVFSFNEVIILEDGMSGVIGFSLISGFIISFVWSLKFFGNKSLSCMSGSVKDAEKHIRSFFLCMFYTAYLVPLFNMCGLGLANVALDDVEGWNERVYGGAFFFHVVLNASSKILKYSRISFSRWLLVSVVSGVLMVNFIYP